MLPSLFIFVKNYKYIEGKKCGSLKIFEALARDSNNSWDEMPQKMVCFFSFVFRYKTEWFEKKHLLNSLEVFWEKVEPITKKSMAVDKTIRAKR